MEEWGAALQGLQGQSGGVAGLVRSGSSMGFGGPTVARCVLCVFSVRLN
jgi:hypothetical protein